MVSFLSSSSVSQGCDPATQARALSSSPLHHIQTPPTDRVLLRHVTYPCLNLDYLEHLFSHSVAMHAQADLDVFGLVSSLATCGRPLDRHEERTLRGICVVGRQVLHSSVRGLASTGIGFAIRSTTSDGTPITVSDTVAAELGGTVITRSGKPCHEFLVACSFYRFTDALGACVNRAIPFEPRPLTCGKTAALEFSMLREHGIPLRLQGFKGEVLEHYAWDRAKFSALTRLVKAWHRSLPFEGTPDLPASLLHLTQFVVTTPCACHDVSKANQWALFFEYSNKELLRDVFVAVESVRHSMDLVRSHMEQWIAQSLVFTEPLAADEIEHLRITWVALGVECKFVELLAETLQLRCRGGQLLLTSSCSSMEDLIGTVKAALLAGWSFKRFTESRWATIGASTQGVVFGYLTGLPSLISFIFDDPSSSKFYLNGWRRLVGDRVQFVVTQALVTRVSEGLLLELMEDSRVMLRIDELKEVLRSEISWLCNLPLPVFEMIGAAAEMSGPALRSGCIRAAHVMAAFTSYRIFDRAEEYPFSLAKGDRDALAQRLADLRNGAEPQEQVAQQLWILARRGYPENRLVRVLEGIQQL